jgi:hypothetical protein
MAKYFRSARNFAGMNLGLCPKPRFGGNSQERQALPSWLSLERRTLATTRF